MSDIVINAEKLGKRYFLGEDKTSFRMKQALHSMAPNKIVPSRDQLWAVRNASFKIRAGEAIGVIGGNGAGKSTLLKILAKITPPTEGHATIHGRVGTLLEVGTGFHPELNGRDNIFLSGAILGMSQSEVLRKFDEIVDFAGVEKFIDTPVKRYSSGMYMRLAFAVAAFLEPEILIVDEVLAVGDAAFQRKSLGRLNDVSSKDGRAVLFVSHNFHAIRNFCKRVILLDRGQVTFDGPADEGLEIYTKSAPKILDLREVAAKDRLNRTTGDVRFTEIVPSGNDGNPRWQFHTGEDITLRFRYEVIKPVPNLLFMLRLRSASTGDVITNIRETVIGTPLSPGQRGMIELTLPNLPLRPTEVAFYACIGLADGRYYYDVIDSNADLPFLRLTSDEEDPFAREGVVSIDYRLKTVAAAPSTTQSA